MSADCCSKGSTGRSGNKCPASGTGGKRVSWTTVAALSSGPVPPRQTISICCDPDCDVVYFGDRGLILRISDLHTVPGFKRGSEGLICYCFGHSKDQVEQEMITLGHSQTLERVLAKVGDRNCACEVRNPAGKCCLKELKRVVQETSTSLKGAA